MRIIHFCAGLETWNGMANTARQFVDEERAKGDDSQLTNDIGAITGGVDQVVIHGAWQPVLWKAAKKAKLIGAKLIIRPAGSYDPVRLAYHGWKKRLVAPFEHRMLRRADILLATCDAEVSWIRVYESKVKAIKTTELKRFFNLNYETRKTYEKGRSLHLLYLGRRHPLKGLEYLETAVRQMQESPRSDCSGWLNMEMKVVSNASGDELEKVWSWCDILILPTLSENFGRVIAEALERGKRVITTDGAPVWGDGNDYGGRLTYLRGYRDGTPEERTRLLKTAIEAFVDIARKV
ncbi:MAG: glycosyltransferase [Kiritimatiellia bacterium]